MLQIISWLLMIAMLIIVVGKVVIDLLYERRQRLDNLQYQKDHPEMYTQEGRRAMADAFVLPVKEALASQAKQEDKVNE